MQELNPPEARYEQAVLPTELTSHKKQGAVEKIISLSCKRLLFAPLLVVHLGSAPSHPASKAGSLLLG